MEYLSDTGKRKFNKSSIDLATNFTFVKPPFSVIRTTSGITIMIVSKLDTQRVRRETIRPSRS